MDYATFNGIPLTTYGLIGATTMLLAYSVFRDDSNENTSNEPTNQESESSKGSFFNFPSEPSTLASEVKSSEEPVKDEIKSITDTPKKDESSPTTISGGKRKRTKRRRHKNKRTKHNRK
jgi:hypothetical protein